MFVRFCSCSLFIAANDPVEGQEHQAGPAVLQGGWHEKYSTSLGLRLNKASTQASNMEARAHGLEVELTRANGERDAQRATAE